MTTVAHRFPFAPLRRRCGVTLAATASALGISHASATVHDRRGVTASVADTLCRAAGVHPSEVWTDWFVHADEPVGTHRVGRGGQITDPVPALTLQLAVQACTRCGAPIRFVAAGTPTDRRCRAITAVVCDHGHRHTLTVTLEAA